MIAIARSCCFLTTNNHHLLARVALSSSHSPPQKHPYASLHSLLPRFATCQLPQPSRSPPSASIVFMSFALDCPPPEYRPNVGVCLLNSQKEVFVARRVDLPDSWQMPQGGVEEQEDPRAAAIRELREETGVVSAEIIGEVCEWLTYDFPPDVKAKVTQLWGKEWKGQAQKWFLFKFTGDESEINVDGDGMERAEFSEWQWASSSKVIELAVGFKRPVYEKVFEFFAPIFKTTADKRGHQFG